jgi:phytoene dehydrogenase-like protein
VTGLPDEADVVVIGAGHNALVCAGYLATAGLEVVVLEARDVIGGNTVTEALTLPGFAHDSCSSAHVLIQANPLLRDDELGLRSSYGLRYVHTDPAVVLPQPDGDALVVHRDLDATVEEVARWSPDDAEALRALMGEWDGGLAAAHGRWGSGLPLGDDVTARRYDALRRRSAWDVIAERFAHPVVRNLMTWLAFATIQSPWRPGTGALPAAITSGRLRYGWATPVGGSGALPDALRRLVEANRGSVVTGAPVTAIEVAGGRATAVRTATGRVTARRGVVSSAHLAGLGGLLDPPSQAADLAEAAATWRPGLSLFAVHAALRGDIAFAGAAGPVASVAGGLGTSDGLRAQLDAFDRGEPDARDPWLLVVASTVVDPDRAPDGGGTLKLLTVAPWELADGSDWADRKDEHAAALLDLVRARTTGLDPGDVLAVEAESPPDLAARNPHNVGGSCHGGEFVSPDGVVHPGWLSHRSSVDGLFLTGATTHPGGSVSGRPGRNAARVVLTDLGLDPSAVMGPG